MIIATRSTRRRSSASWAGRPKWGLKRVYVARLNGICPTRNGSIRRAAARSVSGSRKTTPGAPRRSPNEGNHFSGREGHAFVPVNDLDQQADAAGVRQTDDLLSAFDVDAGR